MQDHSEQWKEWLAEYGNRLLLFARQQSRSEADAEDVLQAALIKTWKTHRGAPNAQVVSLAYTNIRRCAIDLARSMDRRRLRESEAFQQGGDLVSWFSLPEDDTSRALQVAMAKIPEKFREVITLKIWGEQTFDEIGNTLEISPNTAASRYRYGMDALRRCLSRESIETGV
jgi:RNA polymerase sigma-70 factor (ECF subfamily)